MKSRREGIHYANVDQVVVRINKQGSLLALEVPVVWGVFAWLTDQSEWGRREGG